MSIPVVEIDHKHWRSCDEPIEKQLFCSDDAPRDCESCPHYTVITTTDCSACAVEARDKAWAKYLDGQSHSAWPYVEVVTIPASDWEQIKKLAEEKVE